jgi:hypothetical protein
MVKKTGASIEDDLFEFIESRRVTWDDGEREILSRSAVINEQLALARAVTEAIESASFEVDRGEDRERWARQAMLDAVREEEG